MGFGTSNQVSVLQNKANGYKNTIAYEYDANGYITKAGDVTYSYDEAGQLTRVNDPQYGTTVYVYDVGGNIKYVKIYDYTTGELGACLNTVTYGYNNAWRDLLTNYNGQTITYDGSGNPLNYRDGMVFSWELGRQLKTLSIGGKTYSYKYNSDNLRTQKTDGTTTTDFYWADGKLSYQTDGTNDIYFLYDDNSLPIGFVLNETTYYYVKNLQGDIIAILDSNGTLMVEYTYDAWGKLLEISDYSGNNLATINPLRYRGYYYDQETGLYYLQSRYYDPTVGRFINADDVAFLGVNETVLSYNLFVYCENNPINDSDLTGYISISSIIKFIKKIGWKVWKIIKNVYKAFKQPGKIALKPFETVIDMAVGFFVPSLKTALKLLTYKSVNKQLIQAAFRKSGSGFINLMTKFGANISLNSLFSSTVNTIINKHTSRLLSVGGIICLVLDIIDGDVDYWLNYKKIIGYLKN